MTTIRHPAEHATEFDIVLPSMIASSQKQVIRLVSHEIAKVIGIKERILADRLADAERERPSAMGDGVALMHLQMGSLQNAISVFVKLKNAVPMAAPDNQDVDLLCVLLTPEREGSSYLRSMARLSRLLRNPQTSARIRASQTEKAIRSILEQSSVQQMAA